MTYDRTMRPPSRWGGEGLAFLSETPEERKRRQNHNAYLRAAELLARGRDLADLAVANEVTMTLKIYRTVARYPDTNDNLIPTDKLFHAWPLGACATKRPLRIADPPEGLQPGAALDQRGSLYLYLPCPPLNNDNPNSARLPTRNPQILGVLVGRLNTPSDLHETFNPTVLGRLLDAFAHRLEAPETRPL